MRLQLISDLHTEFYQSVLEMCLSIEIVPDLDVLVIAGDLVVAGVQSLEEIRAVFSFFAKKAKHVIYVYGNHDYYNNTGPAAEFKIKSVLPANVTILQNEELTIDGVHFFGGTMWFPRVTNPLEDINKFGMSDFHLISGLESWVYKDNAQFIDRGRKLVKPETIVITHHLPHPQSIAPQFRSSSLNPWFLSDQTRMIAINKPRLWLHGHTHCACDYTIYNTHVVCHPYGYPRERAILGPYKPVVVEV
jgi:Icc-related predicted phosphoesterase